MFLCMFSFSSVTFNDLQVALVTTQHKLPFTLGIKLLELKA